MWKPENDKKRIFKKYKIGTNKQMQMRKKAWRKTKRGKQERNNKTMEEYVSFRRSFGDTKRKKPQKCKVKKEINKRTMQIKW